MLDRFEVNEQERNMLITPNHDWDTALLTIKTILTEDLFQKFEKTLQCSQFVKHVFLRYPTLSAHCLSWHWALDEQECDKQLTDSLEQFIACFEQGASIISEIQFSKLIRLFRTINSSAIAVLELTQSLSIELSARRISSLADIMIVRSYHWAISMLEPRFGKSYNVLDGEAAPQNLVILAMGKLGGKELNFSSDIDLIFFYPNSGETQGGARSIDNVRYYQKLCGLIIKALDEVTPEGFVYRVDMRLRPYGESGALAMSFAQAEDYYQEQGREWERFALLRARPLTGSEKEKKQLDDIIRPFSFRRYIDYGVIDAIRSMKEMIQRDVRRRGLVDNIKLGAGGIREIEFIVQSMQLIQGGRDQRLRERNTIKVLPLLVQAKLIPQPIADQLSDSYRFLRRAEHAIQAYQEKQTQLLPQDSNAQKALIVAMNFDSWAELTQAIELTMSQVNRQFNELLGEKRNAVEEDDDFYLALFEGHVDEQKLAEHVAEKNHINTSYEIDNSTKISNVFNLDNARKFLEQIKKFNSDPRVLNLSSRGTKRLRTFIPTLLSICLRSEQPELTIERLLTVILAIIRRTAYLELLSENAPMLKHLVELVGSSPWVVERLSDYPVLLDELLYPNSLYEPLLGADLRAELQQLMLRIEPFDEEQLMDSLRVFKQTNELRIAASLLIERSSISQVSRYLTQLAEVILEETVRICWRLLIKKHGVPSTLNLDSESKSSFANLSNRNNSTPKECKDHELGFAIIGYGKLGGYELGFGSDLDLVFLFNQSLEGETTGKRPINISRFYTRLAQKIIHFLSTRTNQGALYEVDMRLRPSGSSGLLVSHIDSYADYQKSAAWTWEHQALVRARCVVGELSIRKAFSDIRKQTLNRRRSLETLQKDVVEMRQKMQQELEIKISGKLDLKQCSGGMIDIEFIAQYLALAYSNSFELDETELNNKQEESLQLDIPNNTVEVLKFAVENGLLEKDDSTALIRSYRLFRNKLNELALKTGDKLVDELEFQEHIVSVRKIWIKIFSHVSFDN